MLRAWSARDPRFGKWAAGAGVMRNVVNLMQRPPPRFGRHGPTRVLPMSPEYEAKFRGRDEYAATSPLSPSSLGTHCVLRLRAVCIVVHLGAWQSVSTRH